MSSDVTVVLVDNLKMLNRLSKRLASDTYEWVCLDIETRADGGGKKNLEDHHDSSRIVSVSFSFDPVSSYVVPLSHPAAPWSKRWRVVATELFAWLEEQPPLGVKLVGHNLKYDVRWIRTTTGIDLSSHMAWDTMAGAFLLDENQALGLKSRAVEDLGVEPWADVDLDDAETQDWHELGRYNGLDTAYCFALHEHQRSLLREDPKLGRVMWYILMPAIRTLTRVEHNGLLLDEEETRRRLVEALEERDRLYREFEEQVPAEIAVKHQPEFGGQRLFEVEPTEDEMLSLAPTSKFFQEYAESRWPVLETNDNGRPSWDASVMKRLAAKGFEDARLLLDYRKLDKQISTYLTRWPVDAVGSRLHATYKPARVVTGRLSCERPNLQQVDKKLKTCFVAPPGWKFVQADYSQIEVRLMAHVSKDENLRRVYRESRDVYRETGAQIYDKAPEDLTDQERFTMKAVVLGFLYGMLPPSFVTYSRDVFGVDIALKEAEAFRNTFFETYPDVAAYHERQRRIVRAKGEVRSIFGRKRRLPEINSQDQKRRWSAERQAINAPIQSAASDLMLISLARVDEELDPEVCRIVGTVHDSMLLEVRDEAVGDVVQDVGRVMTRPDLSPYTVELTIPLAVELEIGDRWGDPADVVEVSDQQLLKAAA